MRLRRVVDRLPAEAALTKPSATAGVLPFPRLRLRLASEAFLALPWEQPLADWCPDDVVLRELPVGPSRHLVRFIALEGVTYALKEEPLGVAAREYDMLRRMETLALPAVRAIGIAERADQGSAVLVSEYLRHSLQYRRLLSRVPLTPGGYRDRLLDAMASLLVELHRAGVMWGDCSLANTLFRRDGDTLQAYLVDAETSEVHAELSDGQRTYDLDVLVENVAFGLADLAIARGRPELMDEQVAAAEAVRTRYEALWAEVHRQIDIVPGDRFAIQAHLRRLNDLGFAVGEIDLAPGGEGFLRLRAAVTRRDFHARELRRRTGIVALEGQARLLLNDLREYRAWLAFFEQRPVASVEAARRWQAEVLEPYLARLVPVIGPARDPLQAYCDLLEHKWLRSEAAGRDVGLEAAFASYVAAGAPAPEPPTVLAALDAVDEAEDAEEASAAAAADAAEDAEGAGADSAADAASAAADASAAAAAAAADAAEVARDADAAEVARDADAAEDAKHEAVAATAAAAAQAAAAVGADVPDDADAAADTPAGGQAWPSDVPADRRSADVAGSVG